MVSILTGVLTDGLVAVEAACREALASGIASADVILNILARSQAPESRPRKSAQDDEWSFCLTAGTVVPANQERR